MKKILTVAMICTLFLAQNAYAQKTISAKVDYRVQYLNLPFWEDFHDYELSSYLQKVFKNNHDLKIADLKIKEEEQNVKRMLAQELPQIGLSGNVARTFHSSDQYFGSDMMIPNFAQTNLLFPISASYELDIWGMRHNMTKSEKKRLEITEERRRAAYISITSHFASSYYNLVKCDKLIKAQERLVTLQKEKLGLYQIKFENGKGTKDEVISRQKELKFAQEELLILKKERNILAGELKAILADEKIETIPDLSGINFVKIKIPTQIPSEIIENRPDYIMAEENLQRIGLDVKVARKNLLPRFVLFGQLGLNAYNLSSLFNGASLLTSVGVQPVIDIFKGGQKIAYLKFKKYEYEEGLHHYQKIILDSLREVDEALEIAKTNSVNFENSCQRNELESKNKYISQRKYDVGISTKIDLLTQESLSLEAQKDEIAHEANLMIAFIGLYKSVGGKNLFELNTENI